jgi:hypothetical protein
MSLTSQSFSCSRSRRAAVLLIGNGLLLLCAFAFFYRLIEAQSIAVICTVEPDGGGSHPSIQAAIDDLNCTTVELAEGVFVENLWIERDITISGAGAELTAIDGGGIAEGIIMGEADVTLMDLTIQNGTDDLADTAGGIAAYYVNLVLDRVIIRDNIGILGGGIFLWSGNLHMRNSEIRENRGSGASALMATDSPVDIADSIIEGNISSDRHRAMEINLYDDSRPVSTIQRTAFVNNTGGSLEGSGQIYMSHITVTGNTEGTAALEFFEGSMELEDIYVAGNSGRGIYVRGPVDFSLTSCLIAGNYEGMHVGGSLTNTLATVDSCTFIDNSMHLNAIAHQFDITEVFVKNSTFVGSETSAIFVKRYEEYPGNSVSVSIENSTFSQNSVLQFYPTVVSLGGSLAISNTTIYDNLGPAQLAVTNTQLSMVNSIVAQHSEPSADCHVYSSTVTLPGPNLDSDGSCSVALTGDPLLGPLADNGGSTETHALLPSSPAIDSGSNVACLAMDERGKLRPIDGTADGVAICDLGAFEYDPADPPTLVPMLYLPLIRSMTVGP